MLRSVIVTQHLSGERWDHWVVSVPDDMANERIEELMRELTEEGDLVLEQEEYDDDGEPKVDISAADAKATPNFILTDNGIVYEKSVLPALATEQLQAELDRRRAQDGDTIVV